MKELFYTAVAWVYSKVYFFLFPMKYKVDIGRNDECLCKSGKKFKHCCIDKYRDGVIVTKRQILR